jgi:hypothetical protein
MNAAEIVSEYLESGFQFFQTLVSFAKSLLELGEPDPIVVFVDREINPLGRGLGCGCGN